MAKRIKIGDVFQILCREGVCYGQVIHTHPECAFIIAVFRDFYNKRPKDFNEVVNKEPQLITAFLIQDAVNQGLFTVIANLPVSPHLQKFPIFRGSNNPGQGDKTLWWFWDGEKEWRIERPLTEEEEKKYPKRGLPSAPLLIKRIEDDFRVERDYL